MCFLVRVTTLNAIIQTFDDMECQTDIIRINKWVLFLKLIGNVVNRVIQHTGRFCPVKFLAGTHQILHRQSSYTLYRSILDTITELTATGNIGTINYRIRGTGCNVQINDFTKRFIQLNVEVITYIVRVQHDVIFIITCITDIVAHGFRTTRKRYIEILLYAGIAVKLILPVDTFTIFVKVYIIPHTIHAIEACTGYIRARIDFLLIIYIFIRRKDIRQIIGLLYTNIRVHIYHCLTDFTTLSSHQNHTISTLGTIDCRRRSIFQYTDILDITGRNIINKTIYDIKRRIILGNGTTTTYTYFDFSIRRTIRYRYVHTCQMSAHSLQGRSYRDIFQYLVVHRRNRTCQVFLLHRTVTYNNYFIQHLRVVLKLNTQYLPGNGIYLLGLHTYIWDNQFLTFATDLQSKITVYIGNCSVTGITLFYNGCTDNTFSRGVCHITFNSNLLCRQSDRNHQQYSH